MNVPIRLIIAVAISTTTISHAQPNFGRFPDPVKLEFEPDGSHARLLERIRYIDPEGTAWTVPAGFRTDGASIPQLAWSVIGAPFNGPYLDAAIVHDFGCERHPTSWQNVHRLFYLGMRAKQLDLLRSKIMYAAVYHFGPRWPEAGRTIIPARTVAESEFPRLKELIERREAGLVMETREQAQTRASARLSAAQQRLAMTRADEASETERLRLTTAEIARVNRLMRNASELRADQRAALEARLRQADTSARESQTRLAVMAQAAANTTAEMDAAAAEAANPTPAALPPMEISEIESVHSADLPQN
jgi:hypothetical protein